MAYLVKIINSNHGNQRIGSNPMSNGILHMYYVQSNLSKFGFEVTSVRTSPYIFVKLLIPSVLCHDTETLLNWSSSRVISLALVLLSPFVNFRFFFQWRISFLMGGAERFEI